MDSIQIHQIIGYLLVASECVIAYFSIEEFFSRSCSESFVHLRMRDIPIRMPGR